MARLDPAELKRNVMAAVAIPNDGATIAAAISALRDLATRAG